MILQPIHNTLKIVFQYSILFLMLLAFSGQAQQDKFRWRFGAGVGNQYIKDTPIGADSATGNNAVEVGTDYLSYSALLELSLSQDFGLKIYTLTNPDELKIANSGLLVSYYFDNNYLFSDQAFMAPYVSVGMAFGTSQNSLSLPFGAGLKFRLSDRFNLNLDYTARAPAQNWDDEDYNFSESLQAYASLSLHYNFGRKDDAYKAPIPYVSSYPQIMTSEETVKTVIPTPESIGRNKALTLEFPDTLVSNGIAMDSLISLTNGPDSASKAQLLSRFGEILKAPDLKHDSSLTTLIFTDTTLGQNASPKPTPVNKAQKDSALGELEYAIQKQKLQNELTTLQKASKDSSLNYLMQENQRLKEQLQANEKISALEQRVAQLEAEKRSEYDQPATSTASEYSTDYGTDQSTSTSESDYTPSYDRNYNSGKSGNDFGRNAAAAGTGALIGSAIGSSGKGKQDKQIDRLEAKIDSLQMQIARMQPQESKVAVATSAKNDSTSRDTTLATDTLAVAVPTDTTTQTIDTTPATQASEMEQLKEQVADMSSRIDSLMNYQKSAVEPEPVSVASELEKSKTETFFENSGKVQVFFETNSSELNERSRKKLDDMIEYATAHPQTHFWVKGFTDKTGSARYNEILSKRRAAAVQQYLQESGIDPQRLNIVSLGQDASLGSGDQQYGRRVEVVLY